MHRGGYGPGMMGGYNQDCPRWGQGAGGFDDLSKDQRDQLTGLKQKFIDETYELRQAMFQKINEMRLIMDTSNPDKAKLSTLSGEVTELEKQIRDQRINYQIEAKKIAPEAGLYSGRGFGRKGGSRGGYGGCGGPGYGPNVN